ncbi:MAG: hypothetical protein WCA81_13950 [Rhizomicrobium sp.]
MLITVAAFREPWEAHMFCSRLEAEGVPAVIVHECHIGTAWHYSTALNGVKVQVSDDRKEDAKSIERLCREGEFRSLLEREFGDLDDVRCPNCGSDEHWKRRPLLRAAIAIVVSFLTVIVPPLGWVYFCEKCGTKFMPPPRPGTLRKWLIILVIIACEMLLLVASVCWLWKVFPCPPGNACADFN